MQPISHYEDYERSKVATARSKQGKAVALGIALKLVRYKLDSYVSSILHVIKSHRGFLKPGNLFPKIPVKVVFYCWSGGMRSSAVWWLFRRSASTALFTSGIVCGGYRSYREFARSLWDPAIHTVKQSDVSLGRPNQLGDTNGRCSGLPLSKGSRICIIGGRTGVGKTRVLSALLRAGEQIIDLERIARHSGSVFGWVGQSSSSLSANTLLTLWLTRLLGCKYLPIGYSSKMRDPMLENVHLNLVCLNACDVPLLSSIFLHQSA